MTSTEIMNIIDEWTEWATSSSDGRYDIALFKIWIKFERFLSDLFVNYALGIESEKGYKPSLKIVFNDQECKI